jgi:broad specificity phosphatase PhoE
VLIYAIRHGQTDWNAEDRFQGARDIPLNDIGRGQARANGRLLAEELGSKITEFDFVASPLGRTRETMELIRAELGLPVADYRTDDRIIEVCFGDWETRTLEELSLDQADAVAKREADKWHFIPPGNDAESYEILSWRVASWLSTVDRPTICVCHGGVIRSLFKLVGQLPAEDAVVMPVHQDRIVRIKDGSASWLPVAGG